jgi:hypothetical protein
VASAVRLILILAARAAFGICHCSGSLIVRQSTTALITVYFSGCSSISVLCPRIYPVQLIFVVVKKSALFLEPSDLRLEFS